MSISKTRLKALSKLKDSKVDYSDIPELSASFWKKAKLIMPASKQAISLRVDDDVLQWFKGQGRGYQSLMNAVLKSYVEAKKGHGSHR